MSDQKFHRGDLVMVANDLGPTMRHFTAGCQAIVIGSYRDQFGGDNVDIFTIYIKDKGETSWYYSDQLTLIEYARHDLLKSWMDDAKKEREQKSDLQWIFQNGPKVLDNPHGASVQKLFACLGGGSLWGRSGEGITYYQNSLMTLDLARTFLSRNDLKGWESFCEDFKKKNSAA